MFHQNLMNQNPYNLEFIMHNYIIYAQLIPLCNTGTLTNIPAKFLKDPMKQTHFIYYNDNFGPDRPISDVIVYQFLPFLPLEKNSEFS